MSAKKKRVALSRRVRFEVLKRDGFRCVYCGQGPQVAPLQVDHVVAVASGGTNDPTNLVAACSACNGGKSAVPLTEQRLAAGGMGAAAALEHAEQIRGYLDAQRALAEAREAMAESLREVWEGLTGLGTTVGERGVMRQMLAEFAFADLVGAMQVAAARIPVATGAEALQAFKYLCGIVRRWRETGIVSVQIPAGMTMRGR